MNDLDGRVAIITGAAGGLGRAYARRFGQEGARLFLNDLGTTRDGTGTDPSVVEALVSELAAEGIEAAGNAEDISTMAGASATLAQALDEFGEVHALVNSGGMLRDKMFVSMDVEDWDAIVQGHLRAHFCPTRVLAGYWRERSKAGDSVDGSIVMATSNAGLFTQPGQSNYAAAKAGIAGLALTLAQELDRYGVRVNCISPAARTRMTTEVEAMAQMVAPPEDPAAFDVFDPDNVAQVVAWLCTPQCSATGQIFFVRGGELKIIQSPRYSDEMTRDRQWTISDLDETFSSWVWDRAPSA